MGKTRGVHETTPELRNRMVGMYEAGLGLGDIAAAVNCSQRTVKRWLNRFDREGTVETRERCGRKRATTTEEDDAIIRLATQTPITAAKAVLPALGLSCSVDTIRERLHKAGIHNWSPSRKHMRRIPLGDVDSATMQQAVWRPTGTQLGKKKLGTKESSGKSNATTSVKKKTRSMKIRARDVYVGDGAPSAEAKRPTDSGNVLFSQESSEQQRRTENQRHATNDIDTTSETMRNDETQFGNAPGLVRTLQTQVYQHHPGLNVAQNWPLDLVQGSHHYPQGQPHALSHEEAPVERQLQELHTQREQEDRAQQQQMQDQIQQQQQQQHEPLGQMTRRIETTKDDGPGKTRRPDRSCSNSSSSDDRMSVIEELSKDGSREDGEEYGTGNKKKKKKGGKAKGTLETSLEIRNRMIGMAEAGLSTFSIALAINRSERTVKRWLERWNKEGNVRTKERKGRRRITTKEQDDAIIAMATQHPLTAAKHVAPALGLNCSVDTIRERLHKAGIHSWKLGKKQGEGNAVHTVHLWQPSGNRPNKPKLSTEKRKKSGLSKKRVAASGIATKSTRQMNKSVRRSGPEIPPPPPPPPPPPAAPTISTEPTPVQFHDNAARTEMMCTEPVHNLSTCSMVQTPTLAQVPPSMGQAMQVMGPIMHQRPDCRMTNSIVPSDHANPPIYPSCMVNGGNAHPSHMDHPDPLNYEPYIWSF